MYRIKWTSKTTSYTEIGENSYTKITAQRICNRLNTEYPYINHEIIKE